MKLQNDAFVKWTSQDDEGSFSHVGQIIRFNDEQVQIQLATGVITVPADDGNLSPAKKPADWGFVAPAPKAVSRPAVPRKPRNPRTSSGKTKPELVADLFRDNMPASRQDAINRIFEAGISSSPAGASTAWNSAKKLLK